MADVIWTAEAQADLDAACEYIARGSRRQAHLFAERVLSAAERLRDFPRSGRVVPRLGRDDVREIFVERYRIVYVTSDDSVEIVAVRHAARRMP